MKPESATIKILTRMWPSGNTLTLNIHVNFSEDETGRIEQMQFLKKLEEFAQFVELPEAVNSLKCIMKSIEGKAAVIVPKT
jgi:hypothetical protein